MAQPHAINARAQSGFAKSAAYDEHRPTYSPTATEYLLQQLKVAGKRHAKVLDLAAGTGKFTEGLARRAEDFEIVAVEPHDGMRAVLEAKGLQHVSVENGVADRIPLESESVDAVVAAQAFHWFANKAALEEIHRVLRPDGVLGMIWNIEDWNAPRSHQATTRWEAEVQDLTWTFNDNQPRFRHEQWRAVFEEQSKSTPLSLLKAGDQLFSLPLGEHLEPFETWLSKDKIWERYSTISHIAVLQGEERERTHRSFMQALNGPEVETNEKGEVAIHGNTYIIWTSKIPKEGRPGLTEVETSGA